MTKQPPMRQSSVAIDPVENLQDNRIIETMLYWFIKQR